MVEALKDNVGRNFQRTLAAQQKRISAVEGSIWSKIFDLIAFQNTHGSIKYEYTNGHGGFVATYIESGGATLSQRWHFDEKGTLDTVNIQRGLTKDPEQILLKRNILGKFQLEERKSGNSGPLSKWESEFSEARRKIRLANNYRHPAPLA